MTLVRKFTQAKTAYLPLGILAAAAASAALAFGGAKQLVGGLSREGALIYAVASGLLLVASMGWQWRLYFARRSGEVRRLQREYRQHRWLGIVPMALLIVHVGRPSGSLLSVMSYLLLASCLSGLFNNEILRQKTRRIKAVWLAIHIGTAAFIVPLVIFHIWAAFAFKGP